MKHLSVGLKEALSITLEHIRPLPVERIPITESNGRVTASDLFALVDSPSTDSSMKDGYAVVSHDVAGAAPDMPVRLKLEGQIAPGGKKDIEVKPGTTVRILTGARIPSGADAVLSEEFAQPDGNDILVMNIAEPGRNILPRGRDVECRACILQQGRKISPGMTGLIAAAGHSTVPVFKNPTVTIIGTGDEIVIPGEPLSEGKLYASNIMTIDAWCKKYNMKTSITVVQDDFDIISRTIRTLSAGADAVITSGGAWTGDRDLMANVLEGLGWQQYFHRIRIGPGKAVGFGMLDKKPVFILPGGPSSNLMGFLQIALPGLLALAGHADPGLPRIQAQLAADLKGRQRDWTHFFFGRLEEAEGIPVFHPLNGSSRLRDIAEAEAIAAVPEGQDELFKGSVISVQVLK
ncbi:MAG: molybdopterin biosynthesis protein MoeA [Methanoregula sp. PtaU1.Bin051]|nr:MAG: molybdopterin biosynthesis protein MoeA [Methanoregula sp. PtaU1.Bin051]